MAKNSKLMDVLEQRLMPLATVVSKNIYLMTLRDSFAAATPMLIVGSMFTLIGSFPIPAWTAFLADMKIGDQTLAALIAVPATCTVSMLSIYVSFMIGFNFAEHNRLNDRISAGMASLLSWFLLMPLFTAFTPEGAAEAFNVSSIPFDWIGAKGIFVAIVAGFLSVKFYGALVHRDLVIKMPEGVPPTVARAFSALIPMSLTVIVVWIVRVCFVLTPWDNVFTFIYTFLQIPLQNLGGTVIAQSIVCLFAHVLWFFGIHGQNVVNSVYDPILTALTIQNQEAVLAGNPAPNIICSQLVIIAYLGGAGSTLSLLLAMLGFCKSDRIVKLARLSISPGIFGINEPIMFGLPVVLNPILFIPFILTPLFDIIATWAVMLVGLVPVPNGVMIPWTTPPIISGFLECGWQGAVWQLIMLIIGVVIYLPFIKTLDREYLDEQQATASKREGSAGDEIDSVDLDSMEFDF